MMTRATGVLLVAFFGLFLCVGVSREASAAPGDAEPVILLRTATGDARADDAASMWRYFETWQTDITRVNGEIVNVDVFQNRRKDDKTGQWVIVEPKEVVGSAFPPDTWRRADFASRPDGTRGPGGNDRDWIRHPGPFYATYRRLALICLRGRFRVTEPAQAGELTLTVKFQGGAVAYVNGREVGRAFMPEGPIVNTTPAQDYPLETYVTANGKLFAELPPSALRAAILTTTTEKVRKPWGWDDDRLNRFKQRGRIATFRIPASFLQKGVNVLAVEIHRAPADPVMFLTQDLKLGTGNPIGNCWNRASIEEVTLSAAAPAAGIVPNVRHPEGVRIWVEEALAPMNDGRRFGDPNEPVIPIRIRGVRNGTYAGVAVVSSASALKNLKASVSDLTMGGSVIPASAVRLAYPGVGFSADALNATAPTEIAPPAEGNRTGENAIQPVWVIVKVPRDAAPGPYGGTLRVNVAGEKPMSVPVELKVVGDWVIPDPRDFVTFLGVHESPDSVAMQYKVPLWSEAHWKHLDKVYQLLAEIGTKDVYLPILAKTHLSNEQSMVRWIPTGRDGTYRHDFSIFERYLDTALKHLGKPPVVCLYLHDYGFRSESHADRVVEPCVTQMDPATGKLSELKPPEWGTPEAKAFWKPVIDQAQEVLKKRGVEKSMMFGMGANNWVREECLEDLKAMYPDVLWVNRTHYFAARAGRGKTSQAFGLISNVSGAAGVSYEPDQWEKHCGWRSPYRIINFPRNFVTLSRYPAPYRFFAEGTLLSGVMGWRGGPAGRGLGHIGADFWPVIKGGRRGQLTTLVGRYVFWHSLSIDTVITSILAPGPEGPMDTTRHQLMREALQEAEASFLIREALLDEKKRAKLGPELEARCRAICLERTWALWYYSHHDSYGTVFSQLRWEDVSEKLYAAAADVARALEKQ